MKKAFLLFFLLAGITAQAQPDLHSLQQEWVDTLRMGESTSGFYWDGRSLIYSKIKTGDAESLMQVLRKEEIQNLKRYTHHQAFQHDKFRYITVGRLITSTDSLLLLTGWREVEGSWLKEIDVILAIESGTTQISSESDRLFDQERKKWVELANQHHPESHIKVSYTEDATYFGNGQKSEGRQEIADRYSYMENPNYQVDLKKERLWKISESNVLEIGRYFTGSERRGNGGLYVILWEEQESGVWQIELDFNF
ncbi:hypothetical protein [Gracilimonas sp. BCB1]|uniref:hypothetical protein n=1 Tax=Gracilimonas sp. BCB1 TaxID=3152362 RepID=UPI0032D937CE